MASKSKASSRVWQKRTYELDQLRIGCEMLIKESERLLKKIETDGLDDNYSINSDVLRWARQAHSACYTLSLLRECQVYIDTDCGIIEQLGKETHHGTQDQTTPRPSDGRTIASAASNCWAGARGLLQERWRRETMASSAQGCSRQTSSRRQEQVPRSRVPVTWRFEALALIATGFILGFVLFGMS